MMLEISTTLIASVAAVAAVAVVAVCIALARDYQRILERCREARAAQRLEDEQREVAWRRRVGRFEGGTCDCCGRFTRAIIERDGAFQCRECDADQ